MVAPSTIMGAMERFDDARLAAQRLGLMGEPAPLPGEADRNFRVGDRVLKLHAPGFEPAVLELQDAAMEHVAAAGLAVATPRLVRSAELEGGAMARVLTWVPGTPWAAAPRGPEALRSLGRAVAA